MEKLDRGLVAVQQSDGKVFLSWRLLASDPAGVAFNVYREMERPAAGSADPGRFAGRADAQAGATRLNAQPLIAGTWLLDAGARLDRQTNYYVAAVVDGVEQPRSEPFRFAAGAPALPYHSIPLQTPPGYTPNDASVGDLDGDGQYEIVLHQTGVAKDNSQPGVTDAPIFQAYKLDGTLLWTINLGRNVREGAHYTQFLVYDFDGDGRAELVCKTADGTVDGTGKVLGDANANWLTPESAGETPGSVTTPRREGTSGAGFILSGPEYLTVFDGLTGKALASETYLPRRHPKTDSPTPEQMKETWGDGHGNRIDRFLAGVAYLDGERPSIVMARGYYTRAVLAAWDFRNGKLRSRWVFDSDSSEQNKAYRGQGNHNLSVADVDGDGRDEIVYGAAVIDDDGKGLYSTGWGHGDALHVSDLDPGQSRSRSVRHPGTLRRPGHEPARRAHRQALVHHSLGESGRQRRRQGRRPGPRRRVQHRPAISGRRILGGRRRHERHVRRAWQEIRGRPAGGSIHQLRHLVGRRPASRTARPESS